MDNTANEYSPSEDVTSFDAWVLASDMVDPAPYAAIALMADNPLGLAQYIKVRVQLTQEHT